MNEMKSEHVYICDCQVLAHICSNGVFPAPKCPLSHTGDLGICARIGIYQHPAHTPPLYPMRSHHSPPSFSVMGLVQSKASEVASDSLLS